MRIGHGYDVHRLVPGRKLILGGVEIPWDRGLDGHSDADVLTHAVMDALLGVNGLMPVQETNDEVTVSALVDCMATTNDVNVRSTPSTSSTILVTLPQNSPVAVTGKTEGWYQVLFNDQLAYMSADYLRAVSE